MCVKRQVGVKLDAQVVNRMGESDGVARKRNTV